MRREHYGAAGKVTISLLRGGTAQLPDSVALTSKWRAAQEGFAWHMQVPNADTACKEGDIPTQGVCTPEHVIIVLHVVGCQQLIDLST